MRGIIKVQRHSFFGKGPSFGSQDFTSCTFGFAMKLCLLKCKEYMLQLQKLADSVSVENLTSADRCPHIINVLGFTDVLTTWKGFNPTVRVE